MKRTGYILLLTTVLTSPFWLGSLFAQGWSSMHSGNMMGNGNGYGMMGSVDMMNSGGMAGNGQSMMSGYGLAGHGYARMSVNGSNANIPEQYRLSDRQRKKIRKIQTAYLDEIQPFQKQLVAASEPAGVQKLREKIQAVNFKTRKQINKVMSGDQLAYFGEGHHFLMGMNGGMMAGGGYNNCGGNNAQNGQPDTQ